MKARKLLLWATTRWRPGLTFIVSWSILFATLFSSFKWIQLTGLCLWAAGNLFLAESIPGGMVWRELHSPSSDATPEEKEANPPGSGNTINR
ncbi:TPA: hypothetical protein ACK0K3_004016 [Enterobacter hormaechei]|uniref:hypothetical protein n=1 Tax=Enterobacter cloacae complex TaxID=354276 RepID=UPI0018886826|nr:hypothetical protein [Enterobacter hormaechei]MBF1952101.1 hypothetical protein [Enterobacter hormaechei]